MDHLASTVTDPPLFDFVAPLATMGAAALTGACTVTGAGAGTVGGAGDAAGGTGLPLPAQAVSATTDTSINVRLKKTSLLLFATRISRYFPLSPHHRLRTGDAFQVALIATLQTLLIPAVKVPVNDDVTTASRTALKSQHSHHPPFSYPINVIPPQKFFPTLRVLTL
jgi:hypothetical protein